MTAGWPLHVLWLLHLLASCISACLLLQVHWGACSAVNPAEAWLLLQAVAADPHKRLPAVLPSMLPQRSHSEEACQYRHTWLCDATMAFAKCPADTGTNGQ